MFPPVVIPGDVEVMRLVFVNIFLVFDQTHVIFPPTDKHETKLKGVIYFQAIEEVYYDHLRSATKVRCGKKTPIIFSHLFSQFLFIFILLSLSFKTFLHILWFASSFLPVCAFALAGCCHRRDFST